MSANTDALSKRIEFLEKVVRSLTGGKIPREISIEEKIKTRCKELFKDYRQNDLLNILVNVPASSIIVELLVKHVYHSEQNQRFMLTLTLLFFLYVLTKKKESP